MLFFAAVNIDKFKPSPKFPALQYVGRVDKGSSADISGLQKGDFIIEVNVENEKNAKVIPPGIEPGTLSVLDSRDNRYTTESYDSLCIIF